MPEITRQMFLNNVVREKYSMRPKFMSTAYR